MKKNKGSKIEKKLDAAAPQTVTKKDFAAMQTGTKKDFAATQTGTKKDFAAPLIKPKKAATALPPEKSVVPVWIAGLIGVAAGVLIMTAVGLATGFGADTRAAEVTLPIPEPLETEKTFTAGDIMKAAEESVVSTEFMQRFFDDRIVYKEGEELCYSPIDRSLPQSGYDWTKLTFESERLGYADGETKAVFGIDVSEYQHVIDWKKVAADGVEFAIIRLGYRGYGDSGTLKLDQYFQSNIKGAIDAGIEVGVYFFSQAVSADEAVEEAEFVLENIKDYEVTYPVILDIEDVPEDARTVDMTIQETTGAVAAFCEAVKAAGHRPMIYANTRWFVAKLDMKQLVQYEKWLAQYYDLPFFPYQFQMWQYTDKGIIDGIEGTVDMNLCFSE